MCHKLWPYEGVIYFLAICWFRVDDGWIILDERYDMVVICLNTKLTDIRKELKFQNLIPYKL